MVADNVFFVGCCSLIDKQALKNAFNLAKILEILNNLLQIFKHIPDHMMVFFKVRVFLEGHKILRNLHLTFVLCSAIKSQVEISQNFVAFSEYI